VTTVGVQKSLAVILGVSIISELVLVLGFAWSGVIWNKELLDLILKAVLPAYSPQLGVIFGGIFGQRHRGSSATAAPFPYIAIGAALVWSLVPIALTLVWWHGSAHVQDLIEEIPSWTGGSAILISGVLTAYFAESP
jgi:hypothetical protein